MTTALMRGGLAAASMTAAMLTVAQAGPVTTDDLVKAQDNAGEWLMYGRDYRNWRYSPLAEITPDNAAQLAPVWAMSTGGQFGGLEGHAAVPRRRALLHRPTMRACSRSTPGPAISSGATSRNMSEGFNAMLCCGPIHRGLALKDDLVYRRPPRCQAGGPQPADGKVVWEQTIDDWKNGVTTNSAPLVVKDHVIIGVSGGEYGVRGYLKSFNAKTGALEWQTYTIPAPGEPGSETWPKDDSWKTGGGPTWLTGSYDADTNTLYWGVGNPGSWQPTRPHPGDNLWTDSHARARPRHRQDQVGLPVHAERRLGLRRHGDADPRRHHDRRQADARLAAVSNRNGFFYVIDRTDGKFIYAMPMVEGINWTSGLDPKTGKPTINEAMKPKTAAAWSRPIVPGLEGGTNWFPPAYDPRARLVLRRRQPVGHGADRLGEGEARTTSPAISTWASTIRCIAWATRSARSRRSTSPTRRSPGRCQSPLPLFAGMLATKGGVLFTGDLRGRFLAYRRQDRQGAVEVPDRLRHQRLADHLRAGRQAVCRHPFRPRRRPELLLLGAEGRHALGLRDRRQGRRGQPITTPRSSRRCCRHTNHDDRIAG